jgi:hypothetical protein
MDASNDEDDEGCASDRLIARTNAGSRVLAVVRMPCRDVAAKARRTGTAEETISCARRVLVKRYFWHSVFPGSTVAISGAA